MQAPRCSGETGGNVEKSAFALWGGYPSAVHRWKAASYRFELILAALSLPLFVAAVVGGLGWRSLVILAAGVFWWVMARFSHRRATAAARHHELRRRRLERQAAGTWHGPHRD